MIRFRKYFRRKILAFRNRLGEKAVGRCMIEITNAIEIVKRETGVLAAERIALNDAVGRVLAEDIVADTDLPPFDRSQMDGFAVVASDSKNAPVTLKIVGESAAGRGWHHTMKPGEAVRIMTGAPVPTGADAVQRVELTRTPDVSFQNSGTLETVDVLESVKKGTAIVRKGAEITTGSKLFSKGEVITENMIAAIASFGYATVEVAKKPLIGILATGSEIVDVEKKPDRDQIRNSNSSMLKALAENCGAVVETFPIAGDDLKTLKKQIAKASKNKDILIITGGVSVGKYDLTKTALKDLGAEIFFERVRLKPGKPTVFAKLGKVLVFGLPGNPVSAATSFYLFVNPAIRQMQRVVNGSLRSGVGVLSDTVRGIKVRDSYLPCEISFSSDGRVLLRPLKSTGSSDFIAFARADCLVFVPRETIIEKGSPAQFLILPTR